MTQDNKDTDPIDPMEELGRQFKKTFGDVSERLKKEGAEIGKDWRELVSDPARENIRYTIAKAGEIYTSAEQAAGKERMDYMKIGAAKGVLVGVFAGPHAALVMGVVAGAVGFAVGPTVSKWLYPDEKGVSNENPPPQTPPNETAETPASPKKPPQPPRKPRAFKIDE